MSDKIKHPISDSLLVVPQNKESNNVIEALGISTERHKFLAMEMAHQMTEYTVGRMKLSEFMQKMSLICESTNELAWCMFAAGSAEESLNTKLGSISGMLELAKLFAKDKEKGNK